MDLNRGAVPSASESPPAQAYESWSLVSPDSLFARPRPQTQVIIKKRRLPSSSPAGLGPSGENDASTAERTADSDGSRTPRIFTTKRSGEGLTPASPASAHADAATAATIPQRRRRPAAHKPGEVIRLVLRQDADAAAKLPAAARNALAGPSATPGLPATMATTGLVERDLSPGFDLLQPGLDEHQAVMAALAAVSSLLEDAAAASRLRF